MKSTFAILFYIDRSKTGNSSGINLQLNSIEECLHSLYERTLREENYITAEYLKERYMQQSRPMPTLTELYQSVCEYKEELQGRTLSKATVRAFKDSYKSFVHFLQVRDRADCMPTEVDKTLLEDYRLFMLRDLGNKESSVGNRLRHLHQVIRKALQANKDTEQKYCPVAARCRENTRHCEPRTKGGAFLSRVSQQQ